METLLVKKPGMQAVTRQQPAPEMLKGPVASLPSCASVCLQGHPRPGRESTQVLSRYPIDSQMGGFG